MAMAVARVQSLFVTTILFLGHCIAAAPICDARDRNALLTWKQELADPYGTLSDWDTNPDCCTWLQTRQYRMTTCDSAGRITSLIMGKGLEYKPGPVYQKANGGVYGAPIGNLTQLKKLDLRTIYSGGATLSSTWVKLTKLSNLTLDVLVAGPLPVALLKAWPLQYLDLTNNDLNGTLPVELCKSTLTILKLSGNVFTGPIPRCLSRFPASSFNDSSTGPSGNEGLCNPPLPPCS
ncbi:uncharacterized protein [Physcomitrium patens]|uniref:Leucine-rich repeat-containing N-terminal plant-type domain-containing protein n=1 Tax=Physcomitrium patens TaxID=3218 RepID=A0A2K1IF97_PHYPA|nr:protein NSP-INTERACTING KINASE 2-like [Physcomitrium patens]PNR27950.1 hypothetical protein PHYPA_028542 [Physcomitrium patens]|eukprot:XP_024364468.1 protein NSP-INTERACTING KINASE 2-like [Physcomitrella patens]